MLRKRIFVIRKSPRVRDGRGSRLVGELAEPPATTAVAKPGQPDLPVWKWGLVDRGGIDSVKSGREPPLRDSQEDSTPMVSGYSLWDPCS
jgi:hypothetical protein